MIRKLQLPPSLLCGFVWIFLLTTHLSTNLFAEPSTSFRTPESSAATLPAQPTANAGTTDIGDIYDIYGPVELAKPVPYYHYAPYALITAALICLLVLLYLRRKNRARTRQDGIDPAEQALIDLRRAEELCGEIGSLGYCERVSQILRRYVQTLSSGRIASRTSTELFHALERRTDLNLNSSKPLGEAEINTLKRCFSRCDLAKFARHAPDSDEAASLAEMARSFIAATGKTAAGGR